MDKLSGNEKIEVILRNGGEASIPEEEISLRQIIQALINGRKLIIVVVILSIMLTLIGNYITTPYSGIAKIMISLNFDGIEKGLDPYGQAFDLGKIKAPVVTSKAIKALELDKLGITADDLRRNLVITPVVPGEVVQKIVNLKEYFFEAYGDRPVLANAIGKLDYSEYDYPDVSTIMHNQIEIINNYLDTKNREASDFRSQKTGLAFADIMESVNLIDVVDIN